MRRVILESPYGSPDPTIVDRNIIYARRAVHDSLLRGEAPIASHLLYTQPGILDDNIAAERALGIAAGLAWRVAADTMVFYIDYGVSPGMENASNVAADCKIPIEQRKIGKNPNDV